MYRNQLKNEKPQSNPRKRKAQKNSPTNDETVDFDSNSKEIKLRDFFENEHLKIGLYEKPVFQHF